MRSKLFAAGLPLTSLFAAGFVLSSSFGGPHRWLAAIEQANLTLVALSFGLGALVELVKAKRDAIMLSQHSGVSLGQSFSTMVIGYGLGHALPLAPTGLAFRAFLTQRVAGIPIAFSSGVFIVGSVLEGIGILPVGGFLLLGALPAWEKVLVTGLLLQIVALLLIPVVARSLRPVLLRMPLRRLSGHAVRVLREAIDGLINGLAAVAATGFHGAAIIASLSLLMVALEISRLATLLSSFGLAASPHQLALLMALSWFVGNIPIHLPGAGTWAATKLLHVVGIVGTGAAGYVIAVRAFAAFETPLLAFGVLIWLMATRSPSIRITDLVPMARRIMAASRPAAAEPPSA